MSKAKIITYALFAVFFVFIIYTLFETLHHPEHIHSRDDKPQQSNTDRAAKAIAELEFRLNTEPGNINLWLQLGHIYLDSGNYLKAEQVFRKATVVDPENAEALVDLGIAVNANAKTDEAYTLFKQATEKFPAYAEGWLRLGLIYRFRLQDNANALKHLEKYLTLESSGQIAPQVRSEIEKIKSEL